MNGKGVMVDGYHCLEEEDMRECGATYDLTDEDIVLIVRDGWEVYGEPDYHGLKPTIACVMPTGHDGTHASETVAAPGSALWLMWDGDSHDFAGADSCPLPPREIPSCSLYEGHDGPHPIYF